MLNYLRMVRNDEVYGRFIMYPRHFEKDVIGENFISLRPIDNGGISGFILSRFKENENIEEHKKNLKQKVKHQSISSMGTAIVKDLRNCSLDGILSVDVILTQDSFPYHAEIQLRLGQKQSLVIENLRSPEFMYVCDQIKSILLRGAIAV